VPVEPPPAPEHLSEYARAEWTRIVNELYSLRLLTTFDIAALAAYCEAYSDWRTAREKLQAMAARDPVMGALVIKTRHGSAMQNPLFLTARQASHDMMRYACEFGFTPAARSRINIGTAQPVPGKFDGLLAS
jgi:P27 family predicted phage terminase small subunit